MTLYRLIFTHLDGRDLGELQSSLIPPDSAWITIDSSGREYQVMRTRVDYSQGQEQVRIVVAD